MWTTLSSGQDLRDSGWRFRPNIRWTYNMDRVSVALTSQFLSGHFPSRQYLHRWTLVDDPHCRFCETNIEDRDHILLRCPNTFEPIGYTQRSMTWALTLHGAY